jgi:predicted dehydrogenase
MSDLPVAVVGVGHLGKEHARILATLPGVRLVGVVDPNAEQAEGVAARTGTTAYTSLRALLGEVRAAVIAAPTAHHHAVARELLDAGVSLLVEKPLAASIEQGYEIVQTARRKGVVLQVGHIERYNPAFEELKALPLRPRYVQAERHGGFTGRSMDVGAVLDLMIHDLDLVLSLVSTTAVRIEAMGAALLGGNEDMAQARVTFADGCVADFSACRVSPEVARRMRVWAPEGFAAVDFATRRVSLMWPTAALRGLDSRRLAAEQAAALKTGLHGRFVEAEERDCSKRHGADQLTRELQEFVHCVRTGARPRVDGEAGLAALGLACRVVEALRAGGVMSPVLAAPVARAA